MHYRIKNCQYIPISININRHQCISQIKQGFKTLKLKVGKNLKADIEVLQAIREVHPDCKFILDANEGYKPREAVEVLEKLNGMLYMKPSCRRCNCAYVP